MVGVTLFKPTTIRFDVKTGKKIKKNSEIWWILWRDPKTKRLMRATTGQRNPQLAEHAAFRFREMLFGLDDSQNGN